MKHYPFFLLLVAALPSYAQKKPSDTALLNRTIANVFNYQKNSLRLSDFKGKIIILDFWSTSCLGCIQSFPKIDALQKQLSDKLQILLINRESLDSTQRFFAKRKKLLKPAIPMITADTFLRRYFPHSGVPYHVWIDTGGIARFGTNGYNLNEKNLSIFLKGGHLNISANVEKEPLFTLIKDQYLPAVEYYSYLGHCTDTYTLRPKEDSSRAELTVSCFPVIELYKLAFWRDFPEGFSRPWQLALQVNNPDRLDWPKDVSQTDSLRRAQFYNYHLSIPSNRNKDLYSLMKEDLFRYFGFQASVVQRNLPSLVLVRIPGADLLKTKGGAKAHKFAMADAKSTYIDADIDTIRYLRNYPFSKFASQLGSMLEYQLKVPFFDETKYEGNIDFQIKGELLDKLIISELKAVLRNYGLDIIVADRPIKTLVIEEE